MAKFIYRMDNILNIKLRMESQAKTEYALISNNLKQEEDIMRQLLNRNQSYKDRQKELACSKIDIPEIKRCSTAIKVMQDMINNQAVKIRVAQRNLEAARVKLNAAMQERKIQEKLKENAFEQFKLELNAQEMKEIDEIVSFQYNNRETGD